MLAVCFHSSVVLPVELGRLVPTTATASFFSEHFEGCALTQQGRRGRQDSAAASLLFAAASLLLRCCFAAASLLVGPTDVVFNLSPKVQVFRQV